MRGNKKVLMVCYGGGHVAMVIPVAQRLKELGVEVLVLGLTTAYQQAKNAGLNVVGFKDIIDLGKDVAALEWGSRLLEGGASSSVVAREESIAYLGLSFADLVERCGSEDLAWCKYNQQGRHAFLPLEPIRRLIKAFAPDMVVATNSPRAERAAIMVAVEMGLPSVCLVDLFATQESAWIGQPDYASRVCVLSPFVRERLIALGRHPQEIVVTGNPAFDRLGNADLCELAKQWRQSNGALDKKVIVWASQDEPAIHPFSGRIGDVALPRKIDQILLSMLERHPDWFLVIRHHPSENVVLSPLPSGAVYSPREEDLAVLLSASDVVVILSSTVGLEAALLGKPVVAVELSVATLDAPFAQMGLADGVSSLDALEGVLEAALDGGRPLHSRGGIPALGEAVPNIVLVIDDLLNTKCMT